MSSSMYGAGAEYAMHSLLILMSRDEPVSVRDLAGASGAIGRRLSPLLVTRGWRVIGATRSEDKFPLLRDLGA